MARVVLGVHALVEVGRLEEVVVALPGTCVVLDIISESGALDEGVIELMVGESPVIIIEVLQDGISLVKCL
jgi:hypothetical protein